MTSNKPKVNPAQAAAPDRSNSLADLAARIRTEHEAVSTALAESVQHAMAAGALLIEAKEQIPHGGWLPWLRDHCAISERTAQLYMRTAKNRKEIEKQIRNGVADLSLNEATAILMLTSNVKKLINFARELEHLPPEQVLERCIAEGVGVFQDEGYDPFAGRSKAEQIEWTIFIIFLSFDGERHGGEPDRIADHVEWILQRPFQNVSEWLGDEGEKFRGNPFNGGWSKRFTEKFKTDWAAFRHARRHWTLKQANEEKTRLQKAFEQALADGRIERSP